jgi:hypothetical protein
VRKRKPVWNNSFGYNQKESQMISISKLSKTIALVFVTCAFTVQVMAGSGLMGTLRTGNNKSVLVNSNKAGSGTTIISGARIQCPDKIGATVDLGSLGRLDIAANSDLTLVFVAGKVTVQLRSGYVVLTTNKGITGIVNTSEGTNFGTDPSKVSSVIARMKGAQGPETGAAIGASQGGMGAGRIAGIAAAAAGVVGGAAAVKSGKRGSDLSSDDPRKP